MRPIDADELQALFNEVSTDLLSKPQLAKDAEHIVRACLMVTEMIQDSPTVELPHWIPVEERVPMDDKNVIVCVDGIVTTGYHDERGWFWESDGKAIRRPRVTHWMPLPPTLGGGEEKCN